MDYVNRNLYTAFIRFLFSSLIWTGCGFYSFSGSLAPHLETVAIPLFENQTAEFALGEQVTNTVVDEFTRDNTLRLTDPNDADILIQGKILRVSEQAGAFDQQETVEDLKVYISVSVQATDQVKNQTMWEERLTQWGSYELGGGQQARTDGLNEAIDKISEEILYKTIAGW